MLFYQKIIFPSSQSKEVKITLNIENFEPSTSAQSLVEIENDQQALENATKQLLEKIATASKEQETSPQEPSSPIKETTKQIFEKIAAADERKSVSLESTSEEELEKARLAKMEQKRVEIQKKEQEALAKRKAKEEEKARVEKKEQTRLNALALAAAKKKAKEEARLAKIEQKRLKKEKEKKEALAKAKREKKKKRKKEKAKQKLRKQKLAKKIPNQRTKRQRQRQKQRKQKQTKRKSNDPLANAIMNASTSIRPTKSRRPAMRMIKQFYGSEFNTFTKTQKRFIEKHLGSIYQITQRTLTRNGYPWVAQKTHQQGTAIVTFYLHPNGNISGLRLKKRIGYAALDKNTIKVIRIAYKDYPRPKTKTKITFYVEYSLF